MLFALYRYGVRAARKMLCIVREHWAALLLAIAACLLVGLPSVLAPRALGERFEGIPFLYQDSENIYLSRIHDVLDGHPLLGSPMVYEYKDAPTPLAPLGEYVYVALVRISFLSLNTVVLLSKFLFPLVLFSLVYALSLLLARDAMVPAPRLMAAAAASLCVLGYDLVNVSYALSLLRDPSSLYLSVWTRLVNPITGGMFLFGYLIAVWGIVHGRRFACIPAGILLGAMAGYIFSFSIALSFAGVLLVFSLFARERAAARDLFLSIVLGGVLNIFQIPNILHIVGSPSAREFSLRSGLLLTHQPLMSTVLCAAALVYVAAALIWRYWGAASPRPFRTSELFCGALLLSSFIVMNEQILTGRTVWPEHFVQYTTPLSFIIALTAAGSAVATVGSRWLQRIWMIGLVLLVLLCFVFGLRTLGSYRAVEGEYADTQRLAPSLQWLSQHAQKDCAVFAIEDKERLASLIPALTACNTYETSYVFVGLPRERIEHNYLMRLRFFGITGAAVDTYLAEHAGSFRMLLFRDWKEIFWYSDDPWLLSISDRSHIGSYFDSLQTQLAADYRSELKKDFLSELKEYRLDYVMWDSGSKPEWRAADFPFLHEVYEQGGIHVYEIR